jgi:hypothetical protein
VSSSTAPEAPIRFTAQEIITRDFRDHHGGGQSHHQPSALLVVLVPFAEKSVMVLPVFDGT